MIERVKNLQKWNWVRFQLIRDNKPHEEKDIFDAYVKAGGALAPEKLSAPVEHQEVAPAQEDKPKKRATASKKKVD